MTKTHKRQKLPVMPTAKKDPAKPAGHPAKTAGITGKRVMPKGKPFVSGDPRVKPGPGRPPSAIREALRASFSERLGILAKLADDEDLAPAERMKALEMMAKYGMGTTTTVTDTEGNDAPSPVVVLPAQGSP